MCGLILALGHPDAAVIRGLEAMSYRGNLPPRLDGCGPWTIGHVRLPIQTDESFGVQPFRSGTDIFAFVGEIFGLPEGVEEQEAIYDALRSPNLGGFHHLDGFWSVVEARQSGSARAVTDFLGIKPLYYWAEQNIVCSEVTPMFEVAGKRPKLDEIYLANCIKFGYDPSGRTAFRGITQIAPGTCLTLSPFGSGMNLSPVTYWDWSKVPATDQTLTQLLRESVSNRVLGVLDAEATKPGLLLSGGLDSTIVYTLAKELGLDFDVFSVSNGDDADYLPSDPRLCMLDEYSALPGSPRWPSPHYAVRVMQAPMDLGSLYPQIQLAEALSEVDSKVVLTGDGADELFGGYRRAVEYDSQFSDVFCELPYYHLPRLDRVHMRYTTEVRSPYLSPKVIKHALSIPRADRTSKQKLKQVAQEIGVSSEIIDRPKLPLKSSAVREGGIQYRIALVEAFREKYS